MTDDDNMRHAALTRYTLPFITAGAVAAYFAAPVLKFVNPFSLYIGGTAVALGFGLLVWGMVVGDASKMVRTSAIGIAMATIGIAGLCFLAIPAQEVSLHIDRQCQILETDMERLRPARADSRELFVALQCRPQALSTLQLPEGKGWAEKGGSIFLTRR